MKYKFISVFLVASVGAVLGNNPSILENDNEQNENGYNFRYSLSDGQLRQEIGKLNKAGDNLILRVSGSYSFQSSDGKLIKVSYEADENGYKPLSHETISVEGRTKERELPASENEPMNKPTTEETSPISIDSLIPSTPATGTAVQIASAAIASLAGGGLG